ncbi:extracellular solute-binding protein family 5 [Halorubrum saccharovorum DSM 1137]|uniref:Extracellular solute-binding protein family 5 n=1 Tax=Halorubrum saccharovorum DSM 1137 TaxID=1227484 RepID=M0DUB2_9EURY|nr:ABC transporter substrate-binding protein [Halorubrum saccharovorum]ELZ38413.1 extracellular solute-binding protein family 5 [Halorubrum saccharovorum DSM 1137]
MARHVSRRETLAGVGIAALSAGCLDRTRNIAGRDRSSQLTLEINAPPADRDPNAIRIARHLAENLNAVGIDARINTLGLTDLRRKVLINHNFDVYVGQFREAEPFDPDAMYAFTHSQFVAESGWQNPFGFTDINGTDELLASQRRTGGDERREAVEDLQRTLCELQPFTVVAFPDPLTAVREDRFENWTNRQPLSVGGLLGVERVDAGDGDADGTGTESGDGTAAGETTAGDDETTAGDNETTAGDDETTAGDNETTANGLIGDNPFTDSGDEEGDSATLRLVTTDERITQNWNPIAAEYRRYGTFTSLLYDRLALVEDGEIIPWLAAGWERVGDSGIEVSLRDVDWHDGKPVTAEDVAFTYEFLQDTSMGTTESPVPTPTFRGRVSAVDEATAVDEITVRLTLDGVNDAVGVRALQVPILPKHIWEERTDVATIAGFEVDAETTEAVVTNNEDPIGSGPVRFVEASPEESVAFERNPDHFLVRADDGDDSTGDAMDPLAGIPERFRGKPAFDRLEIEVMGSDIAAVQAVGDGFADATVSNLGPDAVPRIGREADARLVTGRSGGFYHVGYNTRRAPLSNPRFRGVLASLIDKRSLVDIAFDGYAEAAASPLAAAPEWVPSDLQWGDGETDPVHPFVGEPGSLDAETARDRLREAGYRFDEEGRLIAPGA